MFIPVTMYKSEKYAFYGKKCPENRRGFFMRSFGCTRKVYNLYVNHYKVNAGSPRLSASRRWVVHMTGYKAFDADMRCYFEVGRIYDYEPGRVYETSGEIGVNSHGFHFCENIADCLADCRWPDARFAKVEALGMVIRSVDGKTCVTDKIRILEEIPVDEAVKMSNAGNGNSGIRNTGDRNSGNSNFGNRNSGDWNSGNFNSGDRNSGDYNCGPDNVGDWNTGMRNKGSLNSGCSNIGDRNSGGGNIGNRNSGSRNHGNGNSGDRNRGDRNTGDWNVSSCNTGCFMTAKQTIPMFNRPSDWTFEDWRNSDACKIMHGCPSTRPNMKWITPDCMSEKEKSEHPRYITTEGYSKPVVYESDRQSWWDGLDDDKKKTVMNLPNFDADVFFDCTGIRV